MSFGVTEQGFNRKRLSDIKKEIEDVLKAKLGASMNLIAPSVFSTLVGIQAEREALIWELAEDVYNSSYPDTAEGVSLDNAVALSGISRLGATKSTMAIIYLFGTPGTLVPANTVLSVEGNSDARFLTDANSTLIAGTDEVQRILFNDTPDAGAFELSFKGIETAPIPYTANAAAVQAALRLIAGLEDVEVSGDFATGFYITFTGASCGLRPQPMLIALNNTLTLSTVPISIGITETTPGVAQGTVTATAETAGPVQAPAGTLTVIETPVSGLDTVLNLEDAVVGRAVESDLELRQRRDESLQVAGAATVEAITSRLRNLQGVQSVLVIENDTDVTDGDGRPPHSFEAIVLGGEDADIAEEIWESKAAGIATYGDETETITDSMGIPHDIKFSRPTPILIYIEVDILTNSLYPVGGEDLVKQRLVDTGNVAFSGGKMVVPIPTLIAALAQIPGIIDAEIRVGTAPNPTTDANIPIGLGATAVFDTSRVVVGSL